MKNTINDLRDHLFATIEALGDKDEPMDIGRAKAIGYIAGKLIDSAKVEVSFLSVSGQAGGSSFLTGDKPELPPARRKELAR